MADNLTIYNQLKDVPQEARKAFNNGRFSGTDINPMWRIKKMTEIFGMCGFGWYYKVTQRHFEKSLDEKTISSFVQVELYVKQGDQWSAPIIGEGGNTFTSYVAKKGEIVTNDDAYKMALTDAISNATKQLGLGADVWFENDAKVPENQKSAIAECAKIARDYMRNNAAAFNYYQKKYSHCATVDDFSDTELMTIYQQLKNANRV